MNNLLYDEPEYLEYKRLEREEREDHELDDAMDEFCDWIKRTEEERELYEEFG